MNRTIIHGALVAVATIAMTAAACAAQPPVVVNCAKGQKIADALASHPAAAGALTLLVNGTCTEDVTVSRFSGTTIQGNPTATFRPVNPGDTTITAASHLTLIDVTVEGGSTAVFDGPHSFVTVQNSVIKGSSTVGIDVSDNSSLDVIDSTIETTGINGIQTEIGGTVYVSADGTKTTIITGAQNGIFCDHAQLVLSTQDSGEVSIEKNKTRGIFGAGCGIHDSQRGGTISIADNGTLGSYGVGVDLTGGTSDLNNARIVNNVSFGAINASLNAVLQLDHVTITGNAGGIQASQGAVVQFIPFLGPSTVKNNGTHVFGCYQGGQIYLDQIAGTITPAPSKAQLGCLHIGGP